MRKFDSNGKVVQNKDPSFPAYTNEDARLGRNASYASPKAENNNCALSSNVVLRRFVHAALKISFQSFRILKSFKRHHYALKFHKMTFKPRDCNFLSIPYYFFPFHTSNHPFYTSNYYQFT